MKLMEVTIRACFQKFCPDTFNHNLVKFLVNLSPNHISVAVFYGCKVSTQKTFHLKPMAKMTAVQMNEMKLILNFYFSHVRP